MEKFRHVDTPAFVIGSILLALLFLVGIIFIRSRRTKSGLTILFVGPSDGGKTAIFSSLIYNHTPQTITSLQQNTALYRSPSPFHANPLKLVDIPGHPRIRGGFAEYLKTDDVKGIIFVLDVTALSRNGGGIAEHLHLIMNAIASLPPSQKPPPLLIFANKADLISSHPNLPLAISRTTTVLERELEKRRSTSNANTKTGTLEEEDSIGGLEVTSGDLFKFEFWEGGDITVHAGWVRKGKGEDSDDEVVEEKSEKDGRDGLSQLIDWIASLR